MGKDSAIAWTDHTFNPWWGCVKVSPACKNCYAETWAKRTGGHWWGEGSNRRFFGAKHWSEPRRWNREAAAEGVRKRVFCGSMCDIGEVRSDATGAAMDQQRAILWDLIRETEYLTWLLLTKRPENLPALLPRDLLGSPRLWLGTTAEDQECADERIPHLLRVPAAVRFVSAEPLLGPVDLRPYLPGVPLAPGARWADCLCAEIDPSDRPCVVCATRGVDWVIVGGESGPRARLMSDEWVRAIRDQCAAAGARFFLKQQMINGRIVSMPALDGRVWADMPAAAK